MLTIATDKEISICEILVLIISLFILRSIVLFFSISKRHLLIYELNDENIHRNHRKIQTLYIFYEFFFVASFTPSFIISDTNDISFFEIT
jgi:hypothetical protein